MKHLISAWEEATENLASAFVEKYYGKDATEIWWVADQIGGCLLINDDYWSFEDIVTALRLRVSRKTLFEWNEKKMEAALKDKTFYNLRTYAKSKAK